MPLELSPLEDAEIEASIRLTNAAFASTVGGPRLYRSPLGEASIAQQTEKRRKLLRENGDTVRLLKVTDPELGGRMIACAYWTIYTKERSWAEIEEATQLGPWVAEQDVAVSEAFFGLFMRGRREFMGTRPHCRELAQESLTLWGQSRSLRG